MEANEVHTSFAFAQNIKLLSDSPLMRLFSPIRAAFGGLIPSSVAQRSAAAIPSGPLPPPPPRSAGASMSLADNPEEIDLGEDEDEEVEVERSDLTGSTARGSAATASAASIKKTEGTGTGEAVVYDAEDEMFLEPEVARK